MKTVLVTGGAHGIGKQIVLDYLELGEQVLVLDKNEMDFTHENLRFFQVDIGNKIELDKVLDQIDSVDILINNACYSKGGILSGASYEDFDEVLSVGLKAPYYLSLRYKETLSYIVNIASSRAFQSEPNGEVYAATKGGIVALTHALAISLGPKVIVNAIAPGWIKTGDYEISEMDNAAIPLNRVGSPSDISGLVQFLCTQSYITGETIVMDGGMSKRLIYHNESGWTYEK